MTFVLFLLALDPHQLAQQCGEAWSANQAKSHQYAYRQYVVDHDKDSSGKETKRRTQTWDVIGLEGSSYRRLVMENDQPLEAKAQKREDERMKKEAARRKAETQEEKHRRIVSTHYQLKIQYERLNEIYQVRYQGEDRVGETPVWVLVAERRPEFHATSDTEREQASYRLKLWIGQKDGFPVQTQGEVMGDRARLQKGSTFEFRFRHLPDDDTWIPEDFHGDYAVRFVAGFVGRVAQENTFSDFHKFQSESRVVEEEKQ